MRREAQASLAGQRVSPRVRRSWHQRALLRVGLPLALVSVSVLLVVAAKRLEAYATSPYPVTPTLAYQPALGISASPDRLDLEDVRMHYPFRSGETLSDALESLGLSGVEATEVIVEVSRFADLRRLKPSDGYAATLNEQSEVASFELLLAGRGRVVVEPEAGAWTADWKPFERTLETRSVSGSLEGSLEASIERAGGDAVVAYLMAEVLQWDLDFTRDLREGDTFRILYERVYLDGAYDALGSVLAVSYTNRGQELQAYRFGDPAGYYDAEGRPIRKMFLRSPMRFSRVTSSFSHRRFHPILKRYRPHYGVDYGAPTGTPVRVTANGTVTSAGWDGGGGNTVKVRHPNAYLTAYLHLSRFAKGTRAGRRVSQGDVIGYVGATGLATAPHLDYRVRLQGRWINPLSLKSVPADPVPHQELPSFVALRDRLRASLFDGAPFEAPALPVPAQIAEVAEVADVATAKVVGR